MRTDPSDRAERGQPSAGGAVRPNEPDTGVKMKQNPELQQYTLSPLEAADDDVDLGEYLAILGESKWFIIAVALAVTLLGVAYAFLGRPTYAVDVLIQVEQDKTSVDSALGDMASLLGSQSPTEAEMQILQSRMVLGQTIRNLRLDIQVDPAYFPVLGRNWARYMPPDEGLNAPLFGLDSFPWGGEVLQIDSLEVPISYYNQKLKLIAGANGHYTLLDPDKNPVLEGEVGKPAAKTIGHETLRIFVSDLQARPGVAFKVYKYDELTALSNLTNNLKVAEQGKSSGVIGVDYSDYDPELATRTINEIADLYLRQNVERKSAEAQSTLDFLGKQLPLLKQNMDTAMAVLNEYRIRAGSVDMPKETQVVLEQSVDLQSQLVALRQKREELVQRFTPSHPQVVAIDAQIARITGLMKNLDKKVQALPDEQKQILQLERDAKVATDLYITLLNNAQQLEIAKAGTVGNVRIVDHAVAPIQQDKPKQPLVIAIAVVLGLFMGVVTAFVRHALRGGVEDPDVIEKHLGLPVYATIPHSKLQERMGRRLHSNKGQNLVLATQDREDLAIESLRSLRTTLHFVLLEAKNNVLMITGPSPGLGKSFISMNLAAVLVAAGKRVLIVDADLRRGHLHEFVGLQRGVGVSDFVSGQCDLDAAIRPSGIAGLDLMSTGAVPPNPSELLLHERFAQAVQEVSKRYDQVLIDSPPVLAVTDAAVVGRLAGASLLVIKAGANPLREVEVSVKRLRQAGINLRGVIFNDVKKIGSRYGAGKYVYQYAYTKKK